MKRSQFFILILTICVVASGCASNDAAQKDVDSLKSQFIEMQKSIADVNLRMEELTNSIFILQEQSKSNKEALKLVEQPKIHIQSEQPSAESFLDPDQGLLPGPLPQGGRANPGYGTDNIKGSIGEGPPVQESSSGASGAFASAMASYKKNNFGLAVFDFTNFLSKNRQDPKSEQAYYFLGLSYFRLNEFAQAAREWTVMLSRFPNGEKAAEVTYRVGLAYNALGERDNAKNHFDATVQKYAGTQWAQKAAAALRQ